MRLLCALGKHSWVYVKDSEYNCTWQEECVHCNKRINLSGWDSR